VGRGFAPGRDVPAQATGPEVIRAVAASWHFGPARLCLRLEKQSTRPDPSAVVPPCPHTVRFAVKNRAKTAKPSDPLDVSPSRFNLGPAVPLRKRCYAPGLPQERFRGTPTG
jgi:hypothetical protein